MSFNTRYAPTRKDIVPKVKRRIRVEEKIAIMVIAALIESGLLAQRR